MKLEQLLQQILQRPISHIWDSNHTSTTRKYSSRSKEYKNTPFGYVRSKNEASTLLPAGIKHLEFRNYLLDFLEFLISLNLEATVRAYRVKSCFFFMFKYFLYIGSMAPYIYLYYRIFLYYIYTISILYYDIYLYFKTFVLLETTCV